MVVVLACFKLEPPHPGSAPAARQSSASRLFITDESCSRRWSDVVNRR
jgi:hypothetical protein